MYLAHGSWNSTVEMQPNLGPHVIRQQRLHHQKKKKKNRHLLKCTVVYCSVL